MTIGTQRLRLLRGNTAAASAFTGLGGELIVDTGLNTVRVQDGYTPGGTLLATAAQLANVASGYGNTNVAAYLPTYTGNLTAGNILSNNYLYANGVNILTGIQSNYGNSNVASYLTTYNGAVKASSVTTDGADLTLAVGLSDWVFADTGVLTAPGEISTPGNVSAWYFIGDGSQLTGLPATYSNANVAAYLLANPQPGTYSNANVAAYLPSYGGNIALNAITAASNLTATISPNNSFNVVMKITDIPGNPTFSIRPDRIVMPDGNGAIETAGEVWNLDGGNHEFSFPNGARINYGALNGGLSANDISLQPNSTGSIVVRTGGSNDWIFHNSGALTFPNGSLSIEHGMGDQIQSTDNLFVSAVSTTLSGTDGSSLSQINLANDGNIRLRSNFNNGTDRYWDFDVNGALTFPDGTIQTTAFNNGTLDAGLTTLLPSQLSTYTGNLTAGNITVTGNIVMTNGGNITQQNFYGNTGNFYGDPTTGFGAFYAGKTGFTQIPQTLAQMSANYNGYAQVNLENQSAGNQATADYVVTADNGTDSTYYVDLGIASSGYNGLVSNNSLGTSLYANDAYLYAQGNTNVTVGGNLVIGTTIDSKNIKFISGGSNVEHIAVQINHPTRSNTLQVTGGITASNITFPDNYVYSGNTFTSPETDGTLKNFKWKFSDLSYGADTVTLQWNLLDTTFPQWYLTTNSQGNVYVFDGDAKTIGFLDNSINSGTVTFGTAANNGAGSSNDIELTTVTGNAYVRTGSNSWSFDPSGNLTLPVVFSDPPTSPPSTVNGIRFFDALQTTAWTGIAPIATRLSSPSGAYYIDVDNSTGNVRLPGNLEVTGNTILFDFGAVLTQSNSSEVIAAQAEVDSYGDWQANIGGLEPYTLSNTPNGATTFANVVIDSSSSASALQTWITDAWAIQQGGSGDPLWISPAISSSLYNQLRTFFVVIGGSYYRLEQILQSVDLVTGNSVYTFGSDGNLIIPNVASINYANGVNILSGLASTYGNANVAAYLPTYTGNISFGNLVLSSNTSNIVFKNGATIYGDSGGISRNGSIVLQPYTGAGSNFPSVVIGGAGRLAAPSGSVHMVFNASDVSAQVPLKVITGTVATSTTSGALQITGGGGFTGNVYAGGAVVATGNVTGNFFIGNGALLTGISASSNYSNTNVTAFLGEYGSNTIVTTGNITGGHFIGNGALLTGIAAASGNYSDANVAAYLPTYTGNVGGTLTTAAQPYITSVGNLTAANITGNLTVTNINTTGNITGNQPNVTLVAGSYSYTFANTGNVTGITNIFASGYYYANGTAFVGGGGTNYTNANLANIGSNVIVTTGNITAGNLIGIHVGNAVGTTATYTGNVTAANVTVSANVVAGNLVTSGTNGNITGVNIVYANTVVASGYGITMSNRPAMRVYGNSSNDIVANTTLTSTNFTVDYSQGNAFVAGTGIFTAPVAGLYNVTLIARVGSNNGLNQIAVLKNNSQSGANIICFWETDTNSGTAVHFAVAGVANMTVGDTLQAKVISGNIKFDVNDSYTITYIG